MTKTRIERDVCCEGDHFRKIEDAVQEQAQMRLGVGHIHIKRGYNTNEALHPNAL